MYELIQLTERTYYIKSPTNIGLFRLDEKIQIALVFLVPDLEILCILY